MLEITGLQSFYGDAHIVQGASLNVGPGEAREMREILLKFVPTLPERRRIVAQCFIDNFEDFREPRPELPPNVMAPKHSSDTYSPVWPRR